MDQTVPRLVSEYWLLRLDMVAFGGWVNIGDREVVWSYLMGK